MTVGGSRAMRYAISIHPVIHHPSTGLLATGFLGFGIMIGMVLP
jgi:hypothetical protein